MKEGLKGISLILESNSEGFINSHATGYIVCLRTFGNFQRGILGLPMTLKKPFTITFFFFFMVTKILPLLLRFNICTREGTFNRDKQKAQDS